MKYILIAFLLLLIIGWFYWFQWRPSQIRKTCAISAKEWVKQDEKALYNPHVDRGYKTNYEFCLHEKGLK